MATGGLYIALLKSAIPRELKLDIETAKNFGKDASLFKNSQSRAVVSVSPEQQAAFGQKLQNKQVKFTPLDTSTGHNC
ncbi:hypothetical protein C1N53_13650 [Pontibacter sp. SGAir0037]|nr:hypothetical protein C1N53_13650 [Pontibacter sp. SGAir0037]